MDKIIKIYNIRTSNNFYNLEDIVNNIIGSKSTKTYFNKIQNKKRINSQYFISKEQFIQLLTNAKSTKSKNAIKILQENNMVPSLLNSLSFQGCPFYFLNDSDGNIWFKASDIASILGYVKPEAAIKELVNSNQKKKFNELKFRTHESWVQKEKLPEKVIPKIQSQTIFITESGLYSLIFSSKMPYAFKFKNWVFDEVLPSIRKTGKYELNNTKNIKSLVDINYYNNKSCCYLLHIKDNYYKYGKTINIKDRLNVHKNKLNYSCVIKIWELEAKEDLENKISYLVSQLNIKCTYLKHTECFETNDNNTIEDILKRIDIYYEACKEKIYTDNYLIQKEITKQKELDYKIFLKQKEIDYKMFLVQKEIDYKMFLIKMNNDELKNYNNLVKNKYDNFLISNYKDEKFIEYTEKEKDYFYHIKDNNVIYDKEECNEINNDEINYEEEFNEIYDDEIDDDEIDDDEIDDDEIDDDEIDDEEDENESEDNNNQDNKEDNNEIEDNNNQINEEILIEKEYSNNCIDCGDVISKKAKRCTVCVYKNRFNKASINRPSLDELKNSVNQFGYVKTAAKYKVSDNTIRKWINKYEKYN